MARTLAQLRLVGTHAGGGGAPAIVFTDATTTLDTYINDAGRYLCTMRQWNFLARDPLNLDFVAAQAYIALPSDFGQLLSIAGQNSIAQPFRMTSMQQILELRTSLIAVSSGAYVGALDHPTQVNVTTVPAAPKLQLYPTPASNETAALVCQYRAGWTALSSATDVANIPAAFDGLLDELVAAWVKGKARNALQAMLGEVENGPMVANLNRYDGGEQNDFGPPEGGALQCGSDESTCPQASQAVLVTGP